MISVLTLTYKRKHLLEEAIESFLKQLSFSNCEMVIINDCPDIKYIFEHPQIKIINCKERFPSIASKLEWGYKQCTNDYIYRLDDDDLLAHWALNNVKIDIKTNPGYEIYRSEGMYFFQDNKFIKESSNINNGNVYTKDYLDRIKFPDKSGDEDNYITFGHNARIYESKLKHTMIYRWGGNTNHISGYGIQSNEFILQASDNLLKEEKGTYNLHPHFNNDYYSQIKL